MTGTPIGVDTVKAGKTYKVTLKDGDEVIVQKEWKASLNSVSRAKGEDAKPDKPFELWKGMHMDRKEFERRHAEEQVLRGDPAEGGTEKSGEFMK